MLLLGVPCRAVRHHISSGFEEGVLCSFIKKHAFPRDLSVDIITTFHDHMNTNQAAEHVTDLLSSNLRVLPHCLCAPVCSFCSLGWAELTLLGPQEQDLGCFL